MKHYPTSKEGLTEQAAKWIERCAAQLRSRGLSPEAAQDKAEAYGLDMLERSLKQSARLLLNTAEVSS